MVGLVTAGVWGLCGGLAAGLIVLSAAIAKAGFRWPWRDNDDGIWPRLVVFGTGMIVGTLVAAAAHGQMSGPWPAFLMGIAAPSVIKSAISRVEVAEIDSEKVEIPARGTDASAV